MKNILKHIDDLQAWDYYDRENKKIHNWDNNKEHIEFIENFLKISGKMDIQVAFENDDFELKDFERLDHINSVFFLGCLFYEKTILKDHINFYRDDDKDKEKDEFYFIWFITSLIHDFGYHIEKYTLPKELNQLGSTIENFKKYIESKYNSEYYDLLNEENKHQKSDNVKILLDNVPAYYKCRMEGKLGRNCESKIDHGIASGLILFNVLKSIRIKKQKELEDDGITNNIDTKTNLYWGNDLDKFYFIASSSIAVHNMRRVNPLDRDYEKQKNLYSKCDMDNLILNDDGIKKLSIHDDPFLFLLSIIDTIEPIKTFACIPPQDTLENICIDFKDNRTIIVSKREGSDIDFKKLKDNISGLENWIDVETPVCPNDSLTIVIKENEV